MTEKPQPAPDTFRAFTREERERLCTCGIRWPLHFDGWDGNRLSCEEAMRRIEVRR